MLKVKNNDIYLTRGESAAINISAWNADGTPFILPPIKTISIFGIMEIDRSFDHFNRFTFINPIPGQASLQFDIIDYKETFLTYYVKNADITYTRYANITNGLAQITLASDEFLIGLSIGKTSERDVYVHQITGTVQNISINWAIFGTLTCAALTVRSGHNGDIVLQKYFNLQSSIVQNAIVDESWGGWNKFTSQDIVNLSADAASAKVQLKEQYDAGNICIGKTTDNVYCHLAQVGNNSEILPYEFTFVVQFDTNDTAKLRENEYIYDVIIYQGCGDQNAIEQNNFPLSSVTWKKPLIDQHKLVIGGSNNE